MGSRVPEPEVVMRAVWAAVAVMVGSCLAAGQDAKTEKLAVYKPQAGDRTRVTSSDVTDMTVVLNFGGQEKTVPVKTTKTVAYTEEVLAVADGKATKLTRAYTKARTEGAKAETRAYEGETVTIAKAGDKYTFTVNNKPVADADAEDLDKEFNKPDRVRDEDMLPPGPVAVGGEWAIGKKVLAKFNSGDSPITIDPAKSKAVGRLTKAYDKDGRRFGVVKTVVTLAATEMKMGDNPVTLKAGSVMTVDATQDVCFDAGSPAGSESAVITFKMDGELPNGTLAMTGTSKPKKTVEYLGRK